MRSIYYIILSIRPQQWIKNLMIFFPPFLSGSLKSLTLNAEAGCLSFLAFSCVASAFYVFNDLCDVARDLAHPIKRLRPIPAGKVKKTGATVLALILVLLGFGIAAYAAPDILFNLMLYGGVTFLYSIWLKHIPIIDLFCISFGFLVRLDAGGQVFKVEVSHWLFITVLFLSLFLSTGKRIAEQNLLGGNATGHRTSLGGYPEGVLDAILYVTASTVLATYTMYTFSHPQLVYTVPLCAFGLFRYTLRIKSGLNGDPTESLLKDIPLLCVSIIWVLAVSWSIFG